MVFKAVLFDLGLTLIRTAAFPEIYRRILSHFKIGATIDDIVQAQKKTENEFDISTYDKNRRKEFWTAYNISVLNKLGMEDKAVFVAEQIDTLWWEYSKVEVYPDVEPTLSGLKAKELKIGLVSNGFQQDLDYILVKVGLKKWFDVISSIESCNCAKPEKQIFLYALSNLGIEPSEALFVGDSILQDYEGASAVEIKPVLIDREGKFPSQYTKIQSLTELLTII